jgi:hypothetical protein
MAGLAANAGTSGAGVGAIEDVDIITDDETPYISGKRSGWTLVGYLWKMDKVEENWWVASEEGGRSRERKRLTFGGVTWGGSGGRAEVHASELSGKGVNELKEVKRLSAGFYFFSADRIYE